jgi:hypothetical protein
MNALRQPAEKVGLSLPALVDFRVPIPPGGRTGALVETRITWKLGPTTFIHFLRSASTPTSSALP